MSFNNRLLIIDDDPAILEVYRSVLTGNEVKQGKSVAELTTLLDESAGNSSDPAAEKQRYFSVDTVMQGKEGVELIREAKAAGRPYAVAFIDIRMPPGWDGIRTTREIHRVDRDVQNVIVTAYSDASVSEIVSRVGFTDRLLYLKKPFDDEEILQLADSLTARWNLEQKVRTFISILEGIVGSLADLKFSGNDDALRPFLEKILHQLSQFLGTEDVFLAKIEDDRIKFRVGLGKFANGLTVKPAFKEIVKKVMVSNRVEDVFRCDEYLVMPIILRSCKNVVVGVLPEQEVEGIDNLLQVLAENAAVIFDQGQEMAAMRQEIAELRRREESLQRKITSLVEGK